MNITKGEWRAKGTTFNTEISSNMGNVCRMVENSNKTTNAILIADAGNTANKCGLLPSELLEQRDGLASMLELIIDRIEENDFAKHFPSAYQRAKETILKHLKP